MNCDTKTKPDAENGHSSRLWTVEEDQLIEAQLASAITTIASRHHRPFTEILCRIRMKDIINNIKEYHHKGVPIK